MGHGSLYPRLLEYPLTRTGMPDCSSPELYREIEYDKGYFIEYLAQQAGFSFSDAHKEVAQSGSGEDTILPALNRYLLTATGKELATLHRGFAAFYLLSADSPLQGLGVASDDDSPSYSEPDAEAFTEWTDLDPDVVTAEKPLQWSCSVPSELAAKTWAVKLKDGVKEAQWVAVKAEQLRSPAQVELHVLKQNRRLPGQPNPLGRLTGIRDTAAVELEPGDVLYAIVSNPSYTGPASVQLRIEPGLPPLTPAHTFQEPNGEVLVLQWSLPWPENASCPMPEIKGYRVFVNKITQSEPGAPASVKQEMLPDVLFDPNERVAEVSTVDLGRLGGNVGLATELEPAVGGRDNTPRLGPIVWSKQGHSLWVDYWDDAQTRLRRKFTYYLDYGGMKMRDGPEEGWFESGRKELEGERRANRQHGRWRRWWANGQLYDQTQFNAGARQGPYSGWNSDGVLIATGQFDRDRKAGSWRFWYDNGQRRAEGSYEYDTVIHSSLTYFVDSMEEGRYHEIGTKTGRWRQYRQDGSLEREVHYQHGELHGPCTYVNEGGTNDTVHYVNGQAYGDE